MADNKNITYDVSNLEDLLRSLKNEYTLRVGIIGSQAKKQHKGKDKQSLTNAELGTFHEFGSQSVPNHPPRRSFLEDSLRFRLKFNTEEFKQIRKSLFNKFFEKKKPEQFLAELGAKCLDYIKDGFETNGYGAWKSYSDAYYKHRMKVSEGKGKRELTRLRHSLDYWMSHSMLNVTGQLKNSISFKVFKKK